MRDQLFTAVIVPTKVFLVEQLVQHVVTLLAKIDAAGAHLFFRKPLFEPLVAVNSARNEMVEAVNGIDLAQLAAHVPIVAIARYERILRGVFGLS
jgi:hypothetical protein